MPFNKIIFKKLTLDNYGGRVVGVPYIDDVPLNEELIRRGYAVKYDGGKKVKDWCQ